MGSRRGGKVRGLLLALALVWAVGCGGGDSDSGGVVVGGQNLTSPSGQAPTGSASVSLRVPVGTPGASTLAAELPSPWNPLRWLSQPAYAQAFYTLPGARVDAIGHGFAFADSQGVARFLGMAIRGYRFVVSNSDPGAVFQTIATTSAGQTVNPRIDEFTTMASLVATSAALELGTDASGTDLEALVSVFESAASAESLGLRNLVEARLTGSSAWVDLETFLPSETSVRQAVEAVNQAVTYRVAQVPFGGQVYPTEPVFLTLTFNNALDSTTLPGLGAQGWTLTGPGGQTITGATLSASGATVAYTGETGAQLEGRAFPPRTFYFRLPAVSAAQGSAQQYSLSLTSLPRDSQGREILSSQPAASFAAWSFLAHGPGQPGAEVTSNVTGTLDFAASTCQGATNANLSPMAVPNLLLASFDLGSFSFQYQTVSQPFAPPSTERVYRAVVHPSEPISVGDTYDVSNGEVEVLYEERDYAVGTEGPSAVRSFRATEGTLTVTSIQGTTVVAQTEVVMQADANESGSLAQGGFCLQTEMTATFP